MSREHSGFCPVFFTMYGWWNSFRKQFNGFKDFMTPQAPFATLASYLEKYRNRINWWWSLRFIHVLRLLSIDLIRVTCWHLKCIVLEQKGEEKTYRGVCIKTRKKKTWYHAYLDGLGEYCVKTIAAAVFIGRIYLHGKDL